MSHGLDEYRGTTQDKKLIANLRYEDDLVELVENLGDGIVYLTHFARRNAESGCGSS